MRPAYVSYIISLALSLGPGFWALPLPAQGAPEYLVINEIQTTGGPGHTTEDFIELFNPTNNPVNLKGLRLVKRTATGASDTTIKSWTTDSFVPAYGFYLWANADFTALGVTPDVTTSETIADNNGIGLRQGPADTGTLIDSLGWGSATNALVEGSAFPDNPQAAQSLERKKPATGTRQDTNDNAQDFALQTTPTPLNSAAPAETPSSGGGGNQSGGGNPGTPGTNLQPGEVVINEWVSDPVEGGEEWVELYNRSGRTVELSGLTLTEGSGATTQLSGGLGSDNHNRYTVVYSPRGNLNNDGDLLVLKYNDVIIDQVAYGSWNDGRTQDNAPVARDSNATGRLPNGQDTGNDQGDFTITSPTPGQANQAASLTTLQDPTPENTSSISFSEVYPNPPLGDETYEFIELINLGTTPIDVQNWILQDELTSYTLNSRDVASTKLEPGTYLVLPRTKTGIVLDNTTKEQLKLTSADGQTEVKLSYSAPAPEGASWARNSKGTWQWTTSPTPGRANQLTPLNQPPQAVIDAPKTTSVGTLTVFDGSDSVDPEGENLNYNWDFGDGFTSTVATPSHSYASPGRNTVTLSVRDPAGNLSEARVTIAVTAKPTTAPASPTTARGLELTELMPNPEGSDTAEWLELFNSSEVSISTAGWKIKVGTKVTDLPAITLEPRSYVVVNKTDGKFTLTNGATTVELMEPAGDSLSRVTYTLAPEGQSFAKFDTGWTWTELTTPGDENVLETATQVVPEDYERVTLAEVRALAHGSRVDVEGIISVPLGTFGKTIAFITTPGLQLSLSGEGWPELRPGDHINLAGTLSKSSTGTKLLVRTPKRLSLLGHSTPPESVVVPTLEQLSEEDESTLITVSGRIDKVNAASFTLTEGEGSLKVSLKNRDLVWPKPALGQSATVTGVLTLNRDDLVLWARSPEDIHLRENAPKVAGAVASGGNLIDLSEPEAQTTWQSYALFGLLIALLVSAYLWHRFKLPAPRELVEKILKRKPIH